MTDIISISGGISTNAVNLRAHPQGDGDRMAKSANGTLWVHSGSYLELAANSTGVILTVNGSQAMKIDSIRVSLDISLLVNAVNDAAASAAGVAVGELYRNGSVLMVRMV